MAKVTGRPVKKKGLRALAPAPQKTLAAAVLNKGMASSVDPAELPDSALSVARNVRVRFDKTSRRFGKAAFGGAAPDALRIRRIIEFSRGNTSYFIVRVTNTGVRYTAIDGTSWTALAGTLSASNNQHIDHAIVFEKDLIIADGVDRLQLADLETNTLADLGAVAPRASFVTGQSERVVAANHDTVYWSGNRNITEWDAAVDESAGNTRIDTSPVVNRDPITGIFGLANILIIPREQSIFLATKKPIASNPFNFYNSVPNIGADTPGSIVLTDRGIAFISMRHGTAFSYTPGQRPEDIGLPIWTELVDNAEDLSRISAAFDTYNKELVFLVPTSTSVTRMWIYNFRNKSWSYDEQSNLSEVAYITSLLNYTSIDALTGTIDALTGTIDDLSVTPTPRPRLYVGTTAGVIQNEVESAEDDAGTNYTMEIRSKEYRIPELDVVVSQIRVDYEATSADTLILQYSVDSGTTWVTAKTITTTVGGPQFIRYKRQIRTRRLMWRVTATAGLLDILEYEVKISAGGESSD